MAEITQNNDGKNIARKGSKKMNTRIDMTPMVDLGFLLITFFVLVTTFNKLSAMDLTLPTKDPDGSTMPVKESKVVQFLLGSDDKLYFFAGLDESKMDSIDFSTPKNVRPVIAKMEEKIIQKYGSRDSLILLVKPQESSKYKNVVDVLDEINFARIKRYTIM